MAYERRSHSDLRGDSVFARAREKVSIEDYCQRNSVKLTRSGQNELRGACMLCDGGTTKFRVKADRFRCFGCDAHGDVVELVAQHRKEEPFKVARWLLGEDVPMSAPRAREARPERQGPSASDKVAAEILAEMQPFKGSLAERYLLGRGIDAGVVGAASANLRYHARAKHHWDDGSRSWVCAPAMIAPVVVAGPDGQAARTGGVHVTYLDRTTAAKAQLEPAKRMWGPQHLDGKPGGAWLHGPADELVTNTHLVVAEGIETALSFATLLARNGIVARACAALALNRLQGGWLADADGCRDPQRPVPDLDAPAFTWPAPAGDPWPIVWIAVDRDMAEVRVQGRTGRGKPVDLRLNAEIRARVCAQLAVSAWRRAGAASVRSVLPPPGLDFNDELRRVLARESAE